VSALGDSTRPARPPGPRAAKGRTSMPPSPNSPATHQQRSPSPPIPVNLRNRRFQLPALSRAASLYATSCQFIFGVSRPCCGRLQSLFPACPCPPMERSAVGSEAKRVPCSLCLFTSYAPATALETSPRPHPPQRPADAGSFHPMAIRSVVSAIARLRSPAPRAILFRQERPP